MKNPYLHVALLPLIYTALNAFFLLADYGLDGVNIPLILLSHFNVIILSLVIYSNQRDFSKIILALTPLIYCIFFLWINALNQNGFREYEASDSYVYDYLSSLLARPDGLNQALDTQYSYDDLGYPFIRNIFSAYNGSNVGLFLFKLSLHYVSSYLLMILARKHTSSEVASKVGLFYLNTSVALLFVMSGLKESIFTFLTILTLLAMQRSFVFGAILSITTFFFRKVYPLILISSYVILRLRGGIKFRVIFGVLVFLSLGYVSVYTEFLDTYYRVYLHYYDQTLLFAALVSGLLGGLATIDGSDITNYIYSPTVFVVNFMMIQALVFGAFRLVKNKMFLLLMLFVVPLIVLMQAIKVRYLAPFYGLYILVAVSSIELNSTYKYFVSLTLLVILCVSWNILSS